MSELPEKPEPVFTLHACVVLAKIGLAGIASIGLGLFMVSEEEWAAAIVLLMFAVLWFTAGAWLIGIRYHRVREYRNALAAIRESEADGSEPV